MLKTQKLQKLKKKIPNHDVFINTQGFNKLTPENLTEKLKQAKLAKKNDDFVKQTDFDINLKTLIKKLLQVK